LEISYHWLGGIVSWKTKLKIGMPNISVKQVFPGMDQTYSIKVEEMHLFVGAPRTDG